jgi:hypothetical protein
MWSRGDPRLALTITIARKKYGDIGDIGDMKNIGAANASTDGRVSP